MVWKGIQPTNCFKSVRCDCFRRIFFFGCLEKYKRTALVDMWTMCEAWCFFKPILSHDCSKPIWNHLDQFGLAQSYESTNMDGSKF